MDKEQKTLEIATSALESVLCSLTEGNDLVAEGLVSASALRKSMIDEIQGALREIKEIQESPDSGEDLLERLKKAPKQDLPEVEWTEGMVRGLIGDEEGFEDEPLGKEDLK